LQKTFSVTDETKVFVKANHIILVIRILPSFLKTSLPLAEGTEDTTSSILRKPHFLWSESRSAALTALRKQGLP